jgi:phosphatidylglycerol lysyltransferase
VELLLIRYGYALLFAGVVVEGEAALLAAAVLAGRGVLSLPAVIAVAVAANSCADLVYFRLARGRGRRWLLQRFGGGPRFERLLGLMRRRGALVLLLSRFAYGFRIAIPAACGALGMDPVRFAVADVLAGTLWALTIAGLGHAIGGAIGPLVAAMRRYEVAALVSAGALLVVSLAAWLGARHLARLARRVRVRRADLVAIAPLLIGCAGLLDVATALWPPALGSLRGVAGWLPLEVVQRSRPLMLFAGVALLQVARSLSRGKALAYWVALGALSVSVVSHLGHGLGVHHALAAAALIGLLAAFRGRYRARSDPQTLRFALAMAPVLCAVVLAYGGLGLHALRAQFDWPAGVGAGGEAAWAGLLILDPRVAPRTELAARFLGSVQVAGWLGRLYLLVLVLRPVVARRRLTVAPHAVDGAFRAWSRRSLHSFAVQDDKHHLLVARGRGLVAYAVRRGIALSAGDPLAAEDELAESVRGYLDHCRSNGWTPCIYEASEDALPVYRSLGLRGFKMAEEAVIDLSGFSLAGGKRATLRAQVHKAERLGLLVGAYDRAAGADEALDRELLAISDEWLRGKRLAEMGFSLSRFAPEALDGQRVFVCRDGSRAVAFASFRPYRGQRAVVLDFLRRADDAPSGAMDLLLAGALTALRDAGFEEASLANAPLANAGRPAGMLERLLAVAFDRLGGFYGYKSLFQFKKKFAPRWEGRYFVYPAALDLPRVALALAEVHGGGGLRRLLFQR